MNERRSSPKSSDGSSEEEELFAELPPASGMDLQLGGSIYDDALLAPLVGHVGDSEGKHMPYRCAPVLLIINLLLQLVVIYKIGGPDGLIEDFNEDFNNIWADTSSDPDAQTSCGPLKVTVSQIQRSMKPAPEGLPPNYSDEKLFTCMPNDINFFSFMRDIDGDGNLSIDETEAVTEALRRSNQAHFKPLIFFRNIRRTLTKYAKYVLRSYPKASSEFLQAKTVLEGLDMNESRIPVSIFLGQVFPFYSICSIVDPDVCGNAVYRKALRAGHIHGYLEKNNFSGAPLGIIAHDRFYESASIQSMCEVGIKKVCPDLLTNSYRHAQYIRKKACGQPTRSLQSLEETPTGTADDSVLVVDYDTREQYSKIQSVGFASFLGLILILWAISLLEEIRSLAVWWRVLLGCLLDSTHGWMDYEDCVIVADSVTVRFLPRMHCAQAIIMSLLPRTVIAVLTVVYGTQYLLTCTSYEDLIMNSLAVTFLITVDEMIFAAFVPPWRRAWIEKCEAIAPPASRNVDRAVQILLGELVLSVVVSIFVGSVMYFAYNQQFFGYRDRSAILQCLCQASGPRCYEAYPVGGYVESALVPGYEGGD